MSDTQVASRNGERVGSADPPAPAAVPPAVQIVKRDGRAVPYDRSRIAHAVEMAFRAEAGEPYPDALDVTLHDTVERVADRVERMVLDTFTVSGPVEIERIQDEVERQLMAGGYYAVARRYILYREARAARREGPRLRVREASGRETVLDAAVLRSTILAAAAGLGSTVDVGAVYRDVLATLYEGGTRDEITRAMIYAARARIEREPEYTYLAARLLLDHLYAEAIGRPVSRREMDVLYAGRFAGYLDRGGRSGLLDPRLLELDVARLGGALRAERDLAFAFMGVQTLYDRYLLHEDGRRFELPQWFWMRVAMGLALAEDAADREARAIEFYDVLSTFAFCSDAHTFQGRHAPSAALVLLPFHRAG